MAGVYSFLPLGLKVLNNISQIVREEMDAIGGLELLMPALQIKERYEATNRWDDEIVDVWFKTKLVSGVEVGLGFSHEENLSPIVKKYLASYKDLPMAPYQIQMKFRNELRSKSGLMRGREFLMKDMYSYALDQKQHEEFYAKSQKAYERVYQRVGIGDRTVMVLASGGSFSKYSHEFQMFSEAGEDHIFQTSDGIYHNREIAPSKIGRPNTAEKPKTYQEVLGKGVTGVEALLKHLDIPIEKSTKVLFYVTDAGQFIGAAVRSDYDINELKLREAAGCGRVRLATEDEVLAATDTAIGYAGLVHLPQDIPVFVDDSLQGLCNFETGANKNDYHAINVNFGRDVPEPETFYDLKVARQGDLDPETNRPMKVQRAVEVGNIFSLGTKFSAPFGITVVNEKGETIIPIMGCYGLGVSRLMGAIAESMGDDKGLVWPEAIAPFQVYLARLGNISSVISSADMLYNRLTETGIGVLYDDRDIRPGEKFADADLVGIPHRIIVSEKTVKSGKHEYKSRTGTDSQLLDIENLIELLAGTGAHKNSRNTHQNVKQRSGQS